MVRVADGSSRWVSVLVCCQADDEAYCSQKALYPVLANAKVRLPSKCIGVETEVYLPNRVPAYLEIRL